jgi:hypothetical protein
MPDRGMAAAYDSNCIRKLTEIASGGRFRDKHETVGPDSLTAVKVDCYDKLFPALLIAIVPVV